MQQLNEDLIDNQKEIIKGIIKDYNESLPDQGAIDSVKYIDAYVVSDFADIFVEFRCVSSLDFKFHLVNDLVKLDTNRLITQLKKRFTNSVVFYDIVEVKDNTSSLFTNCIYTVMISIQA